MTRPLRIQFENAFYHVMSRGDKKNFIFRKKIYKNKLIEIMDRVFEKHNIICFAYCIMDNHYHLYIKTPEANLSKAIKHLNQSYANWYSKKIQRPGHVMQGRFKSILVDSDNYSLQLVNYIHLNPFRAKRVKQPEKYEYSSIRSYLGLQKPKLKNLNMSFILEQIDSNFKEAQKKYYNFLIKEIDLNLERKIYKGVAIGKEKFLENIDKKLCKICKKNEFKCTRMNRTRDVNKIINLIIKEFKISKKEIFNKKYNNIYRKIAIYLISQKSRLKLKEIGEMFGIKETSVSMSVKRLKKKLLVDKMLNEKMNKICEL